MTPQQDSNCPLCKLCFKRIVITKKYFENDGCIIVDCATCGVPMLVFKEHGQKDGFSSEALAEVDRLFKRHIKDYKRFPNDWHIDLTQRTILDHPHIHLRRGKGVKSER